VQNKKKIVIVEFIREVRGLLCSFVLVLLLFFRLSPLFLLIKRKEVFGKGGGKEEEENVWRRND